MPKIVEHDQYRRALLRRCFDVFAEHGYAKTTMRQLAEALEVSTGTLYHYFPSKQAIFEQLMEQMAQEDSAALDAELAGMATIEAKLEAAMAFLSARKSTAASSCCCSSNIIGASVLGNWLKMRRSTA